MIGSKYFFKADIAEEPFFTIIIGGIFPVLFSWPDRPSFVFHATVKKENVDMQLVKTQLQSLFLLPVNGRQV